MASKLSTSFLSPFLIDFNGENASKNNKHLNLRLLFSPYQLLPASCKMRRRSFSSQHKRPPAKKYSPEQPIANADLLPNGEEDSKSGSISISESAFTESVPIDVEHTIEQKLPGLIVPGLKKYLVVPCLSVCA